MSLRSSTFRTALISAATALVGLLAPTYAFGDACKDVLVNGTMTVNSTSFRQYMDLIDSTVNQDTSTIKVDWDTAATATLPLELPIDVSGSFSGTVDTGRTTVNSTYVRRLSNVRQDMMLASGDPTIVNAWLGCMMRSSSGLALSFSIISPNQAILHARFLPPPSSRQYSLTIGTITLPDQRISSTATSCLSPGKTLYAGDECRMVITIKNYFDDISVTVDGTLDNGSPVSGTVYLPPRIQIVLDKTKSVDYYEMDGRSYSSSKWDFRIEPQTVGGSQIINVMIPQSSDASDVGWVIPAQNVQNGVVSNILTYDTGFVYGQNSGSAECSATVQSTSPTLVVLRVQYRNSSPYGARCEIRWSIRKDHYVIAPFS